MSALSEWKYKITIEYPDYQEVINWCNAYIGKFNENWYQLGIDPSEYFVNGDIRSTWLFKTHEHAVLFQLRWY